MDDDEMPVSKIKHRVKLGISGVGGFGWIFLLGLWFFAAYDSEIRCSLGNKAECVKMEPKAK